MKDDEAIVRKLREDWRPLAADFVEQYELDPDVQEATLRRILSTRQAETPARSVRVRLLRTPRRAVGVLAAVVVAVVAVVVAGQMSSPQPVLAATPKPLSYQQPERPVAVDALLSQFALAAESVPAARPVHATVEHLKLQSWDLHNTVDGRQVTSAVVPTEKQTWRTARNSGVAIARHLPPAFDNDQNRRAWQDDGSPGANSAPSREDYGDGTFPALWPGRPPTDSNQLRVWLQQMHENAVEPAMVVLAIVDLLKERVLTPHEQAAVLRLLAYLPTLEYTGSVTDRAGRRGVAFSVDSSDTGLPTRHTLIIDPATGAFLAYEQTLTSTPGRLNVKIPAVVNYTVFLTAELVTVAPGPK